MGRFEVGYDYSSRFDNSSLGRHAKTGKGSEDGESFLAFSMAFAKEIFPVDLPERISHAMGDISMPTISLAKKISPAQKKISIALKEYRHLLEKQKPERETVLIDLAELPERLKKVLVLQRERLYAMQQSQKNIQNSTLFLTYFGGSNNAVGEVMNLCVPVDNQKLCELNELFKSYPDLESCAYESDVRETIQSRKEHHELVLVLHKEIMKDTEEFIRSKLAKVSEVQAKDETNLTIQKR